MMVGASDEPKTQSFKQTRDDTDVNTENRINLT